MGIFHCYVSVPEGITPGEVYHSNHLSDHPRKDLFSFFRVVEGFQSGNVDQRLVFGQELLLMEEILHHLGWIFKAR